MPQYPCPKCKAVLKRDQPLPPGKKLRCPKCANVFAPAGAAKADAKEEDDRNPYTVIQEKEDDEAMKAEKERAAHGLVKDRYKKSKRGPALKEVVRPSNFLLASGVLNCTLAVILFVIGVGTLVFWDFFYVEGSSKPPEGVKYAEWEAQQKAKGVKGLEGEEKTAKIIERSIIASIAVFIFIAGSLICVGAFKMRSLESYGWGMAGSIICILFGFPVIGFFV